jgi:aldehyde dehydrogenase (NAD+)
MENVLNRLGIKANNLGASTGSEWFLTAGSENASLSPVDNKLIAIVQSATLDNYESIVTKAEQAFKIWREVPAPQRGEVVRQIGNALREYKEDLGYLVSWEMGKVHQEGMGEVQEMIDICDFAVGQSRMLNGFTMHSERKQHRMYDQYHPLGIVGLITSFNFPVAVWAWNAMLAAVCGDVVIWKPSSKTPLTAIATHNIIADVLIRNNVPEGVFNLIIAGSSVLGDNFVADKRIPLFSITGSTAVGKKLAGIIGARLGRSILELGGNNAVIIAPSANLEMAIKSVVFGAVGTAGQRCTSTRRIIVHESIYDQVVQKLTIAYESVAKKIGNPLHKDTLVGPLISESAVNDFLNAIASVKKEGGKVLFGGTSYNCENKEFCHYVVPALVAAENHYHIVQEETFAPILYVIKYRTIEEAIALNNGVPQGLSSSIFTENIREAELFLSETGSDCGIANVNIGTSGAEIGGAFGGEKDTGGGRESGSDSWKSYMRRQTNTINYGTELPLAQGIVFGF